MDFLFPLSLFGGLAPSPCATHHQTDEGALGARKGGGRGGEKELTGRQAPGPH